MFDEADVFTTALLLQAGCTKGKVWIHREKENLKFGISNPSHHRHWGAILGKYWNLKYIHEYYKQFVQNNLRVFERVEGKKPIFDIIIFNKIYMIKPQIKGCLTPGGGVLGHSHLASSLSQILFISKLLISAISLAAIWISTGRDAGNVISKAELGFLKELLFAQTHLDNLWRLDFGISGLCCGVHIVKQWDLLVSQWILDVPQCSSYLLSGHFLLLLSYTASVSSSGGLLLSHVAHPLAKHQSITLKKPLLLKRTRKIIFLHTGQLFRGIPTGIFSADREG